uniref:Uncharacterized protein n=1 Tax=Anguilla anguilla TaxID=7936 RepID=A0A0E9X5W8_ANGAN
MECGGFNKASVLHMSKRKESLKKPVREEPARRVLKQPMWSESAAGTRIIYHFLLEFYKDLRPELLMFLKSHLLTLQFTLSTFGPAEASTSDSFISKIGRTDSLSTWNNSSSITVVLWTEMHGWMVKDSEKSIL